MGAKVAGFGDSVGGGGFGGGFGGGGFGAFGGRPAAPFRFRGAPALAGNVFGASTFGQKSCSDTKHGGGMQCVNNDEHVWVSNGCKVCTNCGLCTGYGAACGQVATVPMVVDNDCGYCASNGSTVGHSGCARCGLCWFCFSKIQSDEKRSGKKDKTEGLNVGGGVLDARQDKLIRDSGSSSSTGGGNSSSAPNKSSGSKGSTAPGPTACQILALRKWSSSSSLPAEGNAATTDSDEMAVVALDIQSGAEHVVILLSNGMVMTLGTNAHGQLGTGDVVYYVCMYTCCGIVLMTHTCVTLQIPYVLMYFVSYMCYSFSLFVEVCVLVSLDIIVDNIAFISVCLTISL